MDNPLVTSLLIHFRHLPEPRQLRNQKHRLLDVMVISICGVLVGCTGPTAIARWAKHKETWLKQFLTLSHGTPSRDCIRRILTLLKPEAFQECFLSWLAQLRGTSVAELEQIVIDGKTLRRSHDRSKAWGALELVSAFATRQGISLAQVAVAEESNEITAIPQLLEQIELKGTVVSIDAIGCQTEIAEQIIKQKGDYVLAVKKNQKNLYKAIQIGFKRHAQSAATKLGPDEYFEKQEKRSGRIEERTYTLVKVPRNFPDKRWPSVTAIGRAVRRTTKPDGSYTQETRYYITSRRKNGADFAQTVRQHWHIENKLHYVLDVVMREDDCRARNRRMATNLAWLRRFALSLLRQHPSKDSLKGKMQAANWNDNFLMQVLTAEGT